MSRLYYLVCTDCLQRSDALGKNYSDAYGFIGEQEQLMHFLFKHENHNLRYVDEHSADYEVVSAQVS